MLFTSTTNYGTCPLQDHEIKNEGNPLQRQKQKAPLFFTTKISVGIIVILLVGTFHNAVKPIIREEARPNIELQGMDSEKSTTYQLPYWHRKKSRHNGESDGTTRFLLLLRHAKSSWDNPWYITDKKRPLAPEGTEAAETLGLYLDKIGLPAPDIIICSPSVRTMLTLQLVQQHWAKDVSVHYDSRLYTLASQGYFDFIRKELDSKYKRIMLVGHNPAMKSLAQTLVSDRRLKKFPPGSFLEVAWEGVDDWGSLEAGEGDEVLLVPPKAIG